MRHRLLYEFNKKARQPQEGDRSCQDQAGSGCPSHVGEDDIDQVIRNNPKPTVKELAETFNIYWTTVETTGYIGFCENVGFHIT
ncbi:UNVERIFIED_CONTAM: hypothetical protein NCL1_41044 [Trichonephila clavipes]